MNFRSALKRIVFGKMPFLRGRFKYFGHTVFFPLGSYIFDRACKEGVYERDLINLIFAIVEPNTTFIDVGANIGLLSVPLLSICPTVSVLSIEASPHTLPFLQRTQSAAKCPDRWSVVGTAVGATSGEVEFWAAGGALGAFDGLKDTGRGGPKRPVQVRVQTLDQIWHQHGRPRVSVIKIDIEGGEYDAVRGAAELISSCRPILLLEWFAQNLAPYNIEFERILDLCQDLNYVLYACPTLMSVSTRAMLKIAMTRTDTFVLAPINMID
jgi:FkbM family methyltransferase